MRNKKEVIRKIYWLNKEIERLEFKTKNSKSEAEKKYWLNTWWERQGNLRALLYMCNWVTEL
jgi:hypothetical protein